MTILRSPFALSLSKGSAEPQVKRTSLRSVEGFDFAQPERIVGVFPEADHG